MKGKKGKDGIRRFHSRLSEHKRDGKRLLPPLLQMQNAVSVSWINDRLPEMVWAALVLQCGERSKGLEVLRRFVILCRDFLPQVEDEGGNRWDPTLTAMSTLPDGVRSNVIRALDAAGVNRSMLSPLLLIQALPARDRWALDLPPVEREDNDAWNALAVAVSDVMNHQSQAATDIRWMTVMFKMVLGRILLQRGRDDEFVEELRLYPNHGDMRRVRPKIRAMEMAFRSGETGPITTPWCSDFWKEGLDYTNCIPLMPADPKDARIDIESVADGIELARRALLDQWAGSLESSRIDAKHDAVFGLALYAVAILGELCIGPVSRLIAGRLLVRTLTEVRITLAFLIAQDDPALWNKYRTYGAGQAKLALLKYEEVTSAKPNLVSQDTLEALANEDYFQEFVPIDLAGWSGLNLLEMAKKSETKDDYDRFYGWTSAFVHGQWAAVRDSVLGTCINPLHRAHRGPLPCQRVMESAIPDAAELVNHVLASVGTAYPPFDFHFDYGFSEDAPVAAEDVGSQGL